VTLALNVTEVVVAATTVVPEGIAAGFDRSSTTQPVTIAAGNGPAKWRTSPEPVAALVAIVSVPPEAIIQTSRLPERLAGGSKRIGALVLPGSTRKSRGAPAVVCLDCKLAAP